MGDIEIAIKRCKRLEKLLEQDFGAAGRGLHEKVSSVERQLPHKVVRRLRFIATVRNKLVHEADVDRLEDRREYERACDEVEKELKRLLNPGGELRTRRFSSIAMLVAIVTGLFLLLKLLTTIYPGLGALLPF
jgi:hypothetical protein